MQRSVIKYIYIRLEVYAIIGAIAPSGLVYSLCNSVIYNTHYSISLTLKLLQR
jgi:hypothetical protein